MENKGFGAGIIIAILVIFIGIFWYSLSRRNDAPGVSNATSTVESNETGTATSPYGRTTIGIGEAGSYRGITITPLSVVEDSRCPLGVQCIQAGTVRVNVESKFDNGTKRQDIIKLGESANVGTFAVSLMSVGPIAKAGTQIDAEDYEFGFEVRQSAVIDEELIGK